jgi:hypothetical protein
MFQLLSSVMNSENDSTNLFLKVNVNGDDVDDTLFDIASSLHAVNSILLRKLTWLFHMERRFPDEADCARHWAIQYD